MANDQLIYGLRPILQATQDGQTIDKVFLQKGLGGALYSQLEGTLRDQGLAPKYVPVEKLNRLTRGNHQGAVAFLSPVDFYDLEEVITKIVDTGEKPLILALDRITMCETLSYCTISRVLRVHAIVLPKNDSAPVVGCYSRLNRALLEILICKVNHIKDAIF